MNTPATSPSFMSPRDTDLIRHYITGGAGVGASAALVTSLLNYLGSTKDEAAEANGAQDDEDTYYLNLRRKKPVLKTAAVGGSVALAAGVMSLLGSYAAVHNVYQNLRKKEMQKRIEAAQQGFVDVAGENPDGTSKSAGFGAAATPASAVTPAPQAPDGKPMALPETLVSIPGAAAILLGLASAGITNKMLEKTFPARKPPGRRDPRRVVIRTDDDADMPKVASEHRDGEELVYRLLLATKSAALNDFKDLVHAIGQGRHAELCDGLLEHDISVTQDMVKGASMDKLEEPYLSMAVGIAAHSDLVAPSLRTLAAAEFNEHFPHLFKLAAACPGDVKEKLCDLADVVGAAMRKDSYEPYLEVFTNVMDKEAGALFGMLDDVLLAQTANNLVNSGHPKHPAHKGENPEGQASEEDHEGGDKPKVVTHGAVAKEFTQKNKDMIDAALAPTPQ